MYLARIPKKCDSLVIIALKSYSRVRKALSLSACAHLLLMVRRNFMYLLSFQCCLLICWLLETLRPAFISLCDHGFVCQLLLHLGTDARPLSLQHPLSL